MLKTKRILLLLFAVLSLLVMASCGGTKSCDECVDGDGEDEYFIGTITPNRRKPQPLNSAGYKDFCRWISQNHSIINEFDRQKTKRARMPPKRVLAQNRDFENEVLQFDLYIVDFDG